VSSGSKLAKYGLINVFDLPYVRGKLRNGLLRRALSFQPYAANAGGDYEIK
jgi:hypothetical protein